MVEIMVVVAILALLASVAIPNLVRARVTANEANAKATLKTISTALETFALANGTYPPNTGSLLGQSPPYLSKDYFTGTQSGYNYAATLAGYTYSILATPQNDSQGKTSFTMATGGVLTANP